MIKVKIYIEKLFIFSTPVSIRHLWQLKAVVFLHWCLISDVLLKPVECNDVIERSAVGSSLDDDVLVGVEFSPLRFEAPRATLGQNAAHFDGPENSSFQAIVFKTTCETLSEYFLNFILNFFSANLLHILLLLLALFKLI